MLAQLQRVPTTNHKPWVATRRGKLTAVIVALNFARDISGTIPPARVVFASVSNLLTMIRVRFLLFCVRKLLVHLESPRIK